MADDEGAATGFEVPDVGSHSHELQPAHPEPATSHEHTPEARPTVSFTRDEYVVVHVRTTSSNNLEAVEKNGGMGLTTLPRSLSNPGVSLDASIHSVAESIAESIVKADNWAQTYWDKWRGSSKVPIVLKQPALRHHALSLFQAAVCITFLAYMDLLIMEKDMVLMVGSFGATAVLVYSAIDSPLAQPRNVIYGHFLSALVGVTMQKAVGPWQPPVAAGLAVGTAIVVMERTHSVHPPGGATALFAVIGSQRIHDLGYLFCIFPCLIGSLVMVFFALLFNNLEPERSYPKHWYFPEFEWLFSFFKRLCCLTRRPTTGRPASVHV